MASTCINGRSKTIEKVYSTETSRQKCSSLSEARVGTPSLQSTPAKDTHQTGCYNKDLQQNLAGGWMLGIHALGRTFEPRTALQKDQRLGLGKDSHVPDNASR